MIIILRIIQLRADRLKEALRACKSITCTSKIVQEAGATLKVYLHGYLVSTAFVGCTVVKSEGKNLHVLTGVITVPGNRSAKNTSQLPDFYVRLAYSPYQTVDTTDFTSFSS